MSYPDPDREVSAITPAALYRRLRDGAPVRLLDVRNREEIDRWRLEAPVRVSIPYMKFQAAAVTGDVRDLVADTPVVASEGAADVGGAVDANAAADVGPLVVVCAEGQASAYVAGLLEEAGIPASNLEGGMRGWARLAETVPVVPPAPDTATVGSDERAPDVDATAELRVLAIARPSSGCLSYLVIGDGVAAVVDPLRAFADRYVDLAADYGADLAYALDTHVHADHVSGLAALADRGVKTVVPAPAVERGLTADHTLADGDGIDVGSVRLTAVHAPGHTTDMTAYAVAPAADASRPESGADDATVLLTGDGLFAAGVPRPDLQAGAADVAAYARDLYRTLTERFARFDDDVLIGPGHYDPTAIVPPLPVRLGSLRDRLPIFAMDADAFVAFVSADMGPRPANYERIIAINTGEVAVDAAAAFELELGPNNCAAGTDTDTDAESAADATAD